MSTAVFASVSVVVVATLWGCYSQIYRTRAGPSHVQGGCDPRFEDTEKTFRLNVEHSDGRGEAFAAYFDGQLVCDLWGGFSDIPARRPWSQDSLSLFLSATKAVAAVCVALLVDRGQLDYDKPVSHYWPHFGKNGKEEITVKSLLSHQAGLPVLSGTQLTSYMIVHNHAQVKRLLEEQFPNWRPGSMHGYHALTYGLYVDHLIRSVDRRHRGVSDYFNDEIAKPFAIDFHIGLPKELHYKVTRYDVPGYWARLYDVITSPSAFPSFWQKVIHPMSLSARAYANPADILQEDYHRMNWREYIAFPFASFFGYGSVRSAAKLFGILANGGVDGKKRLLSDETINKMIRPAVSGLDEILHINTTYGLGYVLLPQPLNQSDWIFGHSGEGGQQIYADRGNKLGWAYVSNRHTAAVTPEHRSYLSLVDTLYKSVVDDRRTGRVRKMKII